VILEEILVAIPDVSLNGGGVDGGGPPSDHGDGPPSVVGSPGSPPPNLLNPPTNPKYKTRGIKAGLHSLPAELHLRMFSYIDFRWILKPIPALARSANDMAASYSAWTFNSGIQALGRTHYHEI
jgi:hypothetical protein